MYQYNLCVKSPRRYTEEERQLLWDIAQLKDTLQRLNSHFGGRQYGNV